MLTKNLLFTCLTILISGALSAQQSAFSKLDSLFLALEQNDLFMGSLTLSHQGEPIYAKAIGYADVASRKKTDTLTKFRIGSISKTFTAALIFKAVEEGKLSLEQTIDVYFPSIPNANNITVGQLLNHRSGLFNFTNSPDYLTWNTTEKTKAELIEIIKRGGSVFEPNTKAEYSNANYVLLSFILETVFDETYANLLRKKITEPLQLNHTYFGDKINLENNEANSFVYSSDWDIQTETDTSIPLGAGAVVSNPNDLNTFMKALFDGTLISKEQLLSMKTIVDGYGMGMFQIPFHDKIGFGHNGGIDGFSSFSVYFPDDELSVALTSNGTRYNNNDLAIAALSSFYGKPFEMPSFTTMDLSVGDLEPYIGVYSSEQIALKMTITEADGTLYLQATGQPAFPLAATETNVFEFAAAGIRLEFERSDNTMVLKQGGGVFEFVKE